jgi:hypothetical protein
VSRFSIGSKEVVVKARLVVFVLILSVAAVGAVLVARRMSPTSVADAENSKPDSDARRSPVLVELFTSEGCSSCPPADELLTRLVKDQSVSGAEVIALSEHVDYWNRLGWADPYSSPEFSARQNDYGRVFGSDEVYTPQMVVDGRIQFVGSNAGKAQDAITKAAREPKANITITQTRTPARPGEVALEVRVTNMPTVAAADTIDVMLALTESGLRSNVSRGENAGRNLTHTAVVRKLSSLGVVDGGSGSFSSNTAAKIEKGWDQSNLRAVVFVQERESRHVLGAGSISVRPIE